MTQSNSEISSEDNPIFPHKEHPNSNEMMHPGMYTIGVPESYGSYFPLGTQSPYGLLMTFGGKYCVQMYINADHMWFRFSVNANTIVQRSWVQIK